MRLLLVLNGTRTRYASGADQARYQRWLPYCAPGTTLEIGYLPEALESDGSSVLYAFGAGDAVTKHAVLYPERCAQAARDGYDAVIMHCCGDPGLAEARRRAGIPVIGPGEATLRAGAILGQAIGVTVPSAGSVAAHREQVREVGVAERVVGIEPVDHPLGPYDQQDPRAMTDAVVAAARRLVARGADVICPSGLAFVPVRVSASEVAERVGVPVLDPALIAVRLAEMLVEARAQRATRPV
jgi:Asp/Glu/hydantoin racemase